MSLQSDFSTFLSNNGIAFNTGDAGLSVNCPDNGVKYRLVPLDGPYPVEAESDITYIYEDRWYHDAQVLQQRILAHLGQFRSVFARKCRIEKIDSEIAGDFFNRYHSYGAAKAKNRYGLFFQDELVAAAAFSEPRLMPRWLNGERFAVESYEWVRYASLPDARVVGGMGRVLSAFVKEVHPQEVMTYADKEWSAGLVYQTLGFKWHSDREPVEFYVNRKTYERVSVRKVEQDNAYKTFALSEDYIRIANLGSAKYLKLFI